MFYCLGACILLFYLPTAVLAIECMECQQELKLDVFEISNTVKPECNKTIEAGDQCVAMLSIDFENKTGSAYYRHLSDETLTFSNGKKITIISATIWLSKNITSQSVQSLGIDSAAIEEDIDKIYNTAKTFKYEDLRAKLREHLYTPLMYVADLTCLNNQGQTVQCPNGFCQLVDNGKAAVDRKCVSQGGVVNPLNIFITSTNKEESDPETGVVYACNKGMCNGAEIGEKVRQLLIDYKLLEPKNSSHPTIANFHWILFLITSIFL